MKSDEVRSDVPSVENLKDLKKVPAGINNTVGENSTGVGDSTAQAINRGNSLPAIAMPIDKKIMENPSNFYDPEETERLAESKAHTNLGNAKTME